MPNTVKLLPVIPLRGLVVFPRMMLHFDAGRDHTIAALESAAESGSHIFLVSQRDARKNQLEYADVYEIGTIARIKQLLRLPGGSVRVLCEGVGRARLLNILNYDPFLEGEVRALQSVCDDPSKLEAFRRRVMDEFDEYAKISGKISGEAMLNIMNTENMDEFADTVADAIAVKPEDRQMLLEFTDVAERMEALIGVMTQEKEIIKADRKISQEVRKHIDRNQKEYYLREKLKVIHDELGEGDQSEAEELKKRIEAAGFPQEVLAKAHKELSRLKRMPSGSNEGVVVRTYLDWLLDIPWHLKTEDNLNIKNAEKVLNEDHYGLEKVKERIIEYLCVRVLTGSLRGPILCFVGPPGVGKTSISSSIARAMNRKFVRMSLGGIRDEAEIRGHRRTYIGAMPGRIIAAMKQAGSLNPIMLLDEIDKLSQDYKGDPASALLEVLDGAQNFAFRDHYLEVPYDLSEVMFITTANSLESIPRPLLDRMEIIDVPSYTSEEKFQIATRHLLPKQMKEHGLTKSTMSIQSLALGDMINLYTAEAGVRNLERTIAAVCRKSAHELIKGKNAVRVTRQKLRTYLGPPKHRHDRLSDKDEVGIATGLAWTSVGGETLSIEVTPMPGTGQLTLTGQLGDVMKESAQAGVSYVRANALLYGIDPGFHKTTDLHIHVPAGATPKDGPSAGIAIVTAIVSALSGVPVRGDVAMTGEVTLRGRVLPIGGLREKLLAAHREGIKTVLLPEDNRRDLESIPECVKAEVKLITLSKLDDVLLNALAYLPAKHEQILQLDQDSIEHARAIH